MYSKTLLKEIKEETEGLTLLRRQCFPNWSTDSVRSRSESWLAEPSNSGQISRDPEEPQEPLKRKAKLENSHFPILKLARIKTEQHWHKDRHTDKHKRNGGLEVAQPPAATGPSTAATALHGERRAFQQMGWDSCMSTCRRRRLDPYLTPHTHTQTHKHRKDAH